MCGPDETPVRVHEALSHLSYIFGGNLIYCVTCHNKKFNDTLSEKKNQNNSSTFHLATTKVSFVAFAFEDPVES